MTDQDGEWPLGVDAIHRWKCGHRSAKELMMETEKTKKQRKGEREREAIRVFWDPGVVCISELFLFFLKFLNRKS